MRFVLFVIVIVVAVMGPFAGEGDEFSVRGLWLLGVFPALALVLFFVLPLDMTMCRLYMTEQPDPGKQRYRMIIRYELFLLFTLIGLWIPFISSLILNK